MKYTATKIISIIMVFVLLLVSFAGCGVALDGKNPPKDSKNLKNDVEITLDGEYFSIDYSLHVAETENLKRVCLGENGEITTIYYYNSKRRENFYYTDGKLEYSETILPDVLLNEGETIYVEHVKLFETRYVYDGDRIVRGEVFYNGYPTQSYDEYEYTDDGALKTVKRYELGALVETYNYNGKKRPESVQNLDRTFIPEYDENGNVIAVDVNSESNESNCYTIEIEYSDKRPSHTVQVNKNGIRRGVKEAFYYFHSNGMIGEISTIRSLYNQDGTLYAKPSTTSANYNEDGYSSRYDDDKIKTEVNYDGEGRLASVIYFNNSNKKTTTLIEFGESGKIVKRSLYKGDDTEPILFYEYDENGNLIRFVTDEYMYREETLYEYYPNGVKKKKTEINNDVTVVYTYAENGNLLTQDFGGRSFIEYVDTELCYGFERSFSTPQFNLDATGNLARRSTLKNGFVFEYEYDKNYTYKTKMVQKFPDGRMIVQVKSEDKKYVTLTEYDKDGNILHQEVNEVREYTDGFGIYGS